MIDNIISASYLRMPIAIGLTVSSRACLAKALTWPEYSMRPLLPCHDDDGLETRRPMSGEV
jgi:hypothetical protein